jgi:putative Mg2+ transporter-C (MgtC) family protein
VFEEALVRFAVAAALAAVIGIDRELRSKPAGLRTNIVVGVAAAAFTYTGAELFEGGDPTRVSSQIVSGIGFLGGGAIFAAGNEPRGLTTAAALWGSASIGVAAGLGNYEVAIAIVLVTVVALIPLDFTVARLLQSRSRQIIRYQIVVPDSGTLASVLDLVEQRGFGEHPTEVAALQDRLLLDVRVEGSRDDLEDLTSALREHPDLVVITSRTADAPTA